jgi:hypothetical protein
MVRATRLGKLRKRLVAVYDNHFVSAATSAVRDVHPITTAA